MNDALIIFAAGLGGVFAGMGLLYVTIRLISAGTKRFFNASHKKVKK
ncbi:MAG: hypothetical protein JRH15_18820 [Deltaproteobacteria bacterium]|nr:hypothetical protein [Deltaproteobacteria bacterium]